VIWYCFNQFFKLFNLFCSDLVLSTQLTGIVFQAITRYTCPLTEPDKWKVQILCLSLL